MVGRSSERKAALGFSELEKSLYMHSPDEFSAVFTHERNKKKKRGGEDDRQKAIRSVVMFERERESKGVRRASESVEWVVNI